jgi:hypothetical protein
MLARECEDGPQTYLGVAIAGYPNPHAEKQAFDHRGDATGTGYVGRPRPRGRERDFDDRCQFLVLGRGKARRFLPYLGPEGVGGYRRKCAEVAEKGYEGFVFAGTGQDWTVHPIAAE